MWDQKFYFQGNYGGATDGRQQKSSNNKLTDYRVIPNHRFLVAMLTDAVLALHMHTFTHNQISLLEYSVLFTRAAVHTHAHEHLETRDSRDSGAKRSMCTLIPMYGASGAHRLQSGNRNALVSSNARLSCIGIIAQLYTYQIVQARQQEEMGGVTIPYSNCIQSISLITLQFLQNC